MKDKKKIIILGSGIILLVVIVIGILLVHQRREDEKRAESDILYNENANFLKDQQVEGFLFEHIQCQFNGDVSLVSYDIVNQSEKEVAFLAYEMVIKDKSGKIMTVMEPSVEQVLLPGEKTVIQNEVNIDLTRAVRMEIRLKEKEA